MKKNKRNIEKQSEEIIRYLEDKMTSAERNAFEKKLQSDPFLKEAVEGFSLVGTDSAGDDLASLSARVERRTRGKNRLFYRVAAAIILLLGISSVLLVRNLREPEMSIAENRKIANKLTTAEPVIDFEEGYLHDENLVAGKQEKEPVPEKKNFDTTPDKTSDSLYLVMGVRVDEEAFKHDEADTSVEAAVEVSLERETKAEQAEPVEMTRAARPETLRKSANRNEVLVTMVAGELINRKAQPVTGEEEFLKYLADKQVYPDGFRKSEPVEVRLELIVEEDGSIGKIEVLDSPYTPFSDEAIRLIKEGPAWLPSYRDGVAVKDTVNIKVVFR